MINLMYLVFIAMMAINVSVEVLDGFELVERSLKKTTDDTAQRNKQIKKELDDYYQVNPVKVQQWYDKGNNVVKESDDLYNYIQKLKEEIAEEADGKNWDLNSISHRDDLEASSHVMLSPITGEGKKLREQIVAYREKMGGLVDDAAKMSVIESILAVEIPSKTGLNKNWESTLFENMPVAAAITILTKLQNDVRYVEGEVLASLITNIDVGSYRTNKIEARVIPQSQFVMQGTPYKARVVLTAVDSTQSPDIYVNDQLLPESAEGWYTGPSGTIGENKFSGKVVLKREDGEIEYPFSDSYFVSEQTVTIASTMMSILYENIDNDLEISIPGVPSGSVRASVSAGTLTQKNSTWTVRPPSNAKEVNITVTATGSNSISITKTFKVRPLPPATPYLSYKDASGTTRKFTGGPIAKRNLLEADGVMAAIDDGLLDIQFTVTGFELVFFDSMGNALPEVSQSGAFTQSQKDKIRNLSRGKRFYITRTKANDPGGISQTLATIEVIVN
jgi:gliding motility-associated protein GldM